MTNHLNNHQHYTKKNFGERIWVHKPDLRSLSNTKISDKQSGNDRRKVQQQQSTNRSIVELSILPMLVPELPSHVPTPKTIETNDEPWTNKIEDALDGIHYHIQTIFSSAGDNNGHHHHNNSSGSGKNNTNTNRGKPIKNAPSPISPPESPLSTSRKSKAPLTMATPLQSRTKWGPDFWQSQKSLNTASNNDIVTNTTIARSPSWVESLDDSSNITMSPTTANAIAQTNSSSSNDVDNDVATQDALLRAAMARKKAGRQQRDCKQSPPSTPRSVDNTLSVLRETPPMRPCTPSSSTSTVSKDDILVTKVKRFGMSSISAPPLTVSNEAQLPPLQLQWIHDNAVNLQTSCHDDHWDYSIRTCDGDNELSPLPPIMDE
mmetsp:Transcript_21980/g.47825  ORF Transcript_21980/g.47825 Transcript_21980/m.47825 type:complete len:376 (-) Transcript_21980:413-1540(-)|eukprot:CAMPEP_0168227842 /NCGR_PEP_ID=MMETSP0140_2-20121125/14286_1 /TAXON_ID=44445 /ORGANISM="Pseudo-nitzschia australis, Strain 10249 10 AB" /LENGTH=375 /DNA_ID=CAMNT_0008159271 /DNA_START=42 /DNA_END=1169 /DNA_ORIENTATION=+